MTSTRTRTRRVVWPVTVGVIVLALAVIVALATTREAANRPDIADPAVGGTSLPAFDGQAALDDPAIGQLVPSLIGDGLDGEQVNPTRNARAKLFLFLAHWCPHCQVELPIVVDWLESGRAGDLDVIAVITGTDPLRPNYPPDAWLEREGWSWPTLVDASDGRVAQAYGLTATPYFVLTDAEDRVLARSSGELTPAQLDQLAALANAGATG